MNSVLENPFRVLGISPTASTREIAKARSELMIYIEMGKVKTYWHDSVLPGTVARTLDAIENAANQIEKPSSKLLHALFWFWEGSSDSIDEMAFDLLGNGNKKKARDFWVKGVSPSAAYNSPSNYKNLAILDFGLCQSFKPELKAEYLLNDLSLMGSFLSGDGFNDFCNAVLGDGVSVNVDQVVMEYTSILINELSGIINLDSLPNFRSAKKSLSKFPGEAQSDFSEKVMGVLVSNIKKDIDKYDNQVEADESSAAKYGIKLYERSNENIEFLSEMVISGDLQYQTVLDKYFNTLLQSAISAWNSNDVSEGSKILDKILKIEKIVLNSKSNLSQRLIDRATEQFDVMHKVLDDEKKLKPLLPLVEQLNKAHKRSQKSGAGAQYEIAKNFVYGIKQNLDKFRRKYRDSEDSEEKEIIENVVSNCSHFVNQCGVTTANDNSEYGRAIELVDMAQRILLYPVGYNSSSMNSELSNQLKVGRRTLANNISSANGLLGMAIGGGIRVFKKNTKCGCGSGRNLNECCSV